MLNQFKKILVIGAHPDDETLGLGGTINACAKNKSKINCLIFTDGELARRKNTRIQQRKNQSMNAAKVLGINKIDFLGFVDQKLDIIPVVDLSKKIETAIEKFNPDTIFTHFWGDVNQDHRRVFEATNIATRAVPDSKIKNIICYETPSSSEWGIETFRPNFFVDISKSLSSKIKAFKKYTYEVRKFPHPRSEQAIKDRASFWGSTSGMKSSEAFMIYRIRTIN